MVSPVSIEPEHVVWSGPRPRLKRPTLIAAFEGWNDAGDAATTAAVHLAGRWGCVPVAEIDPEPFFDFTAARPTVHLDESKARSIKWPVNEVRVAHLDDPGSDAVVLIGTEPLLATNLGTGTPETSAALVEYCNVENGTRWSDLRREHGYEQPHKVKTWCLGNEMDGWWQIGHMPAREYGRKARDAARQIRSIDPSTELIACGSSAPFMPTYLIWDRETLEECYPEVDGLSLHRYYGNTPDETGEYSARFLALNLDMDYQIKETIAVCDYVGGLIKSARQLWLSFDEWNVWYRARSGEHTNGQGKFAPPLLEEVYNLEDALLVGGMVNTLLRNADRVRIGCLAQIINVIAALVTNKDGVLRQTIYYPYAWGIQYAKGDVLDLLVRSETYSVERQYNADYVNAPASRPEETPYLDVSATFDPESGNCGILLLNRDLEKEREVELRFEDITPTKVIQAEMISGSDLKATNTFDDPNNVAGQRFDAPSPAAKMNIKLPARSYTALKVATG